MYRNRYLNWVFGDPVADLREENEKLHLRIKLMEQRIRAQRNTIRHMHEDFKGLFSTLSETQDELALAREALRAQASRKRITRSKKT